MKTVLGIDIGLSAIGWSVAERPTLKRETLAITSAGVRVTTLSSAEKLSFKRGDPPPSLKERKAARSSRRMRERYQLRRERLVEALTSAGIISADDLLSEDGKYTTYETWMLRAKAVREPVTLQQFARILLMINKTRGCSKKRIDDKAWTKEFHESGLPYGEFVCGKILNGEKIVGHQHLRDDRIAEFEAIWYCQSKYHPQLTEEFRKEVRDGIIFYQRALRTNKAFVPYCRYESWEKEVDGDNGKRVKRIGCKCAPRSSPAFQRFRIWQVINNISIYSLSTGEVASLSLEQLRLLAEELEFRESMTPKEIIEFLYPDSPEDYVTYTLSIHGNTTMARLAQFVPQESLAFDPLLPKEEYEKQTSFRLWHLISSFQEDESEASLVKNLMEVAGVDEDTARKMSGIKFEDRYAHLSHKAIRKLLPSLLDGQKFATAVVNAGYKTTSRLREKLNELPIIEETEVRNPIFQKLIIQMTHVVNELTSSGVKPDALRVRYSIPAPRYIVILTANLLRKMISSCRVYSAISDESSDYADYRDFALSASRVAAGSLGESFDFNELCRPVLDSVLVSFKPRKRVATRNANRIRTGGRQTLVQECLTPRGQIHKENVYGIREIHGKTCFAVHKPAAGSDLQEGQKRALFPVSFNLVPLHVKHDKDGRVILDAEGKPVPNDYVVLRNNHHVAFYEDTDGKLHEVMVSFKEALERVMAGKPAVDREYMRMAGWDYKISFSVNEMLVFPGDGFVPSAIDLLDKDNYPLVSKHLFRVQKISHKQFVLKHHLCSATGNDPRKRNIDWMMLASPKAFLGVAKVRLNHIGEIVEVVEICRKSR